MPPPVVSQSIALDCGLFGMANSCGEEIDGDTIASISSRVQLYELGLLLNTTAVGTIIIANTINPSVNQCHFVNWNDRPHMRIVLSSMGVACIASVAIVVVVVPLSPPPPPGIEVDVVAADG